MVDNVNQIRQKLINYRRDFHEFPEMGWTEYRTASVVANELERFGYEVIVGERAANSGSRMGVPHQEILLEHEKRAIENGADPEWVNKMAGGQTTVIGRLKLDKPGPVIALRFDMDALPINENKSIKHFPVQKKFNSSYEGLMHACGHDGHVAIGLGVAEIISHQQELLGGEIRLLFQPAEEGTRGAKSIVDAGWLNGVDYFFSAHIGFQSKKLGEVVATVGGFYATTKMDVTFYGIASHAGQKPEQGKNALLAAAAATLHLHSITRHSDGVTRINVGNLYGGTGRNIIADTASLSLETRGESTELNEFMKTEAIRIIENTAKLYDVSVKWEIVGEAPGAKSNEELIPLIQKEITKMQSVKSVIPYMDFNASDDVVYMLNEVQKYGGMGTYMLFGSPLPAGHHQVLFDFNEEVLGIGVEAFVRLILASQKWQKLGNKPNVIIQAESTTKQ